MQNITLLKFTAALLLITPAKSATTYSLELSTPTNSFFQDTDFGDSSSSQSQVGGANATFNTNFNALGNELVTVEFNAPAGQKFSVSTPSGWSSSNLSISWGPGGISQSSGVPGNFDALPPLISFGGLEGIAPTLTNSSFQLNTGFKTAYFGAFYSLTPGTTFSFTSFSMSATVPAGYDLDFSATNPSASPQLRGSLFANSLLPDPGPWITIVPEPSHSMLAMMGALGLVLRRRR